MKILNIPFFSQLDDSVPKEHQRHVCALACIKMILDSKDEAIVFEDIYAEANIVGNKVKEGWTHETIVRILRNHKVLAYRQEFLGHSIDLKKQIGEQSSHTDLFVEIGIAKIKKSIDFQNPVMVSVRANFSENKEDHVVLVVGYEEQYLYVFDPILSKEQNPKKITINDFKKFWKNFAIFVE